MSVGFKAVLKLSNFLEFTKEYHKIHKIVSINLWQLFVAYAIITPAVGRGFYNEAGIRGEK